MKSSPPSVTCRMRLPSRWSHCWRRALTPSIIFATPQPAFATSRVLRAAILKCGATSASATRPRSDASFPPTVPSSTGWTHCWSRRMAMASSRSSRARALRAMHGLPITAMPTTDKYRALNHLDLQPVARMTGTVRLPGSKSISNRILLLAALARGVTRIEGLLEADDVDRMLEALHTLGIPVEHVKEERVAVVYGAAGAFPVKRASLSLGNAGTAFRPLTAALAFSGVDVQRGRWARFIVPAHWRYVSPGSMLVEGGASSASYFLAAGAVAGGPVRVIGVGVTSIQGDTRFADVLAAMGAAVDRGEDWIEVRRRGPLKGIDADFNMIPDAAMTAAVVALFAEGPTTLRNIASWRVKETDRIAAMATELSKLGAVVDQGPDWLRIVPPAKLRAATIDTYDDHRMAMSFSLAALGGVAIRINDPQCVSKTFPDYFAAFAKLAA